MISFKNPVSRSGHNGALSSNSLGASASGAFLERIKAKKAYDAARARNHTQGMHRAEKAAYRATHAILSKPKRTARWWQFWVR